MNFKLSTIVAATLAAAASVAFADPTSPNVAPANYTTDTTDIFLSGSSAVDLALTKFIANSCLPNTLDTYRTDAGGKTYYLWTCETNNTAPNFVLSTGHTKIAIHKNTNSSSDGVVALSAGTPLAYLQVSDLNSAASQCAVAPTVVAATSTIPSYNVYNCGTTAGAAGVGSLSTASRFGFSDSEPKQFSTTAAPLLTSAYPLTIVFGVPVTKNVRDALQTAQGLTAGDESEAGMPNLTSAQINSLFTNKFASWSNLGINVGTDNTIYVVRRSAGSGTTRAFDATFITDICIPGATGITAGTTLNTATLGTQCVGGSTKVLQAGTSDDMANCLSNFNNTGAVGAVGYLSTDYLPGGSDGYRWVKVDGYSPKLLNVVDGKWKDWSEEALNYVKATPLAGDDLSFYNTIKATSANGGLISEIAKNLPQTTSGQWTGGVLGALPNRQNVSGFGLAAGASLTLPRTDASVLAYPANPATRATSGGYNLCAVPLPQVGYTAE
jgi:ABC-type phosphate transport system substrate-binding protein